MLKYGFKIKTRGGMIVDALMVAARDRTEAERKVAQIYHRCEILSCQEMPSAAKDENISYENLISMIGREPDGAPVKKPDEQ
jgi:hypothetical protein